MDSAPFCQPPFGLHSPLEKGQLVIPMIQSHLAAQAVPAKGVWQKATEASEPKSDRKSPENEEKVIELLLPTSFCGILTISNSEWFFSDSASQRFGSLLWKLLRFQACDSQSCDSRFCATSLALRDSAVRRCTGLSCLASARWGPLFQLAPIDLVLC